MKSCTLCGGEQASVRSTGDCEKREVICMKSCTLCGGEQASVRSTGDREKREVTCIKSCTLCRIVRKESYMYEKLYSL
jgi:hypothetical protein